MNWFQQDSYTQKNSATAIPGRARMRAFISQLVASEMARAVARSSQLVRPGVTLSTM